MIVNLSKCVHVCGVVKESRVCYYSYICVDIAGTICTRPHCRNLAVLRYSLQVPPSSEGTASLLAFVRPMSVNDFRSDHAPVGGFRLWKA